MADDATPEPRLVIGWSVQGDGHFVGMHVQMPGTEYAVLLPYDFVEQFKKEMPGQLDVVLKEAHKQRTGIVTPPQSGGGLVLLKGDK